MSQPVLTVKQFVEFLRTQAETCKMGRTKKALYFINGFNTAVDEGMDQVDYWREAVAAAPELIDAFYSYSKVNPRVSKESREFLKKLLILK